jgi:hypothetical protein
MALVPLIKKMEYLNSQGSKNYYLAPLFDIFESRKNNIKKLKNHTYYFNSESI